MTRRFFSTIALLCLFAAANPVVAQSQKAAVGALPAPARRAYYQVAFMQQAMAMYAKMGLGASGLSLPVFREGLVGYYNLRSTGNYAAAPPVLTLIDFSQSSQQKRLWVINVEKCKVLFHTLVAHGKASGEDRPLAFSNKDGSEMSSLGFYRTAPTTYMGKHGLSLKIAGMDPGFNSNAESRAVVVHGADYVCEDFVKAHGRLGRSQGCPALPVAETAAIVKTIRGGSVIYLHGPAGAGYRSQWLNVDTAASAFASQRGGAGRMQ
ncbi:murein L,D-transpeptidase catalytic domain family protein [Hymenobacter sp. BT442]|uniref:Murein L,D-transpeptidase catalytic domain family protein n=1 Tax=Hymenobacter negativus TaxID=2795026 RepID=A0ABS0Q2T4_9BACT|nr:murein L,D-transpeptidase catalytic domain family protein [Hymenobacter negativus]MBH8569223.1 murein L,D-transpeptidase catalytic domain family protein [Hymenobacter negativus]